MERRFLHYIPGPKDLDSSPWSMRLEEGTGSSRKGDRRMVKEVDLLPDGTGVCQSAEGEIPSVAQPRSVQTPLVLPCRERPCGRPVPFAELDDCGTIVSR